MWPLSQHTTLCINFFWRRYRVLSVSVPLERLSFAWMTKVQTSNSIWGNSALPFLSLDLLLTDRWDSIFFLEAVLLYAYFPPFHVTANWWPFPPLWQGRVGLHLCHNGRWCFWPSRSGSISYNEFLIGLRVGGQTTLFTTHLIIVLHGRETSHSVVSILSERLATTKRFFLLKTATNDTGFRGSWQGWQRCYRNLWHLFYLWRLPPPQGTWWCSLSVIFDPFRLWAEKWLMTRLWPSTWLTLRLGTMLTPRLHGLNLRSTTGMLSLCRRVIFIVFNFIEPFLQTTRTLPMEMNMWGGERGLL